MESRCSIQKFISEHNCAQLLQHRSLSLMQVPDTRPELATQVETTTREFPPPRSCLLASLPLLRRWSSSANPPPSYQTAPTHSTTSALEAEKLQRLLVLAEGCWSLKYHDLVKMEPWECLLQLACLHSSWLTLAQLARKASHPADRIRSFPLHKAWSLKKLIIKLHSLEESDRGMVN